MNAAVLFVPEPGLDVDGERVEWVVHWLDTPFENSPVAVELTRGSDLGPGAVELPAAVWDAVRARAALTARLQHVVVARHVFDSADAARWEISGWASPLEQRQMMDDDDSSQLFEMELVP